MNNKKDLLVIIPCYNEQHNILNTINNIKNNCVYDFLVIEDGSKDKSLQILKENNINFIKHQTNMGLSEALRSGMKYALDNDYKYTIQIDGDNQHDPKDISKFLDAANNKEKIIVIGNRYDKNNSQKSLKISAQKFISFWFFKKTGIKLFDPTNGMRLFDRTFMIEYVNNHNFMVEPSTIAYIVKNNNLNIIQVHTEVKEREYGQSMYNNVWRKFKYVFRESYRTINFHWVKKKIKEK